MFPKIKSIRIQDDYVLIVWFDNGIQKRFDIQPKLSEIRFEPLKDKALFRDVRVDQGGYGISWNDEIDLSEYELWTYGVLLN